MQRECFIGVTTEIPGLNNFLWWKLGVWNFGRRVVVANFNYHVENTLDLVFHLQSELFTIFEREFAILSPEFIMTLNQKLCIMFLFRAWSLAFCWFRTCQMSSFVAKQLSHPRWQPACLNATYTWKCCSICL